MLADGLTSSMQLFARCAGLLILLLAGCPAFAMEPYRVLPPHGEGPHPAALLVPGCSGFVPVNGVNLYEERAAELQAAGYLVVFVDFVGRRNLSNCGHVSKTEVGADILEAANWTRAQAGIDPGRIFVIGWSYGGGGVLAALAAMQAGPPAFAKAVTYYPDCRGAKPKLAAGVPMLMLVGTIDDVAPASLCDAVVKGAAPGGVRVIAYPNARHAFDSRGLPERTEYPFGTLGYNAEAARDSWRAVLDFLG
jgi:dienelactone hydrolase